jgi:hypothetical protein
MPVEFANVFISAKSDSAKIVSGTITDSTGYFSLSNISFGEYYLYIQFIGFAKYKQSVVLNQENINISLPNIVLKSDVSVLNAVEVTAIRNLIKKTEEGIVMNASENITHARSCDRCRRRNYVKR